MSPSRVSHKISPLYLSSFRLGEDMRFVLTYRGPLKANGTARDKHDIRQAFHPQLKEQWRIESALLGLENPDEKPRGDFRFIPIVAKNLHLVCRLEIVLLRPEEPGNIIKGGDIDNRLKTLFDSLSIPPEDQIKGMKPQTDEIPFFFCLLEDDIFVTSLEVRTERLLKTNPDASYAELFLTVKVYPMEIDSGSYRFLGGM